MKKYLFFLFLFLFLFRLPLYGSVEYDIDSKRFIPFTYYVGSPVELQINIKVSHELKDISLPPPEKYPVSNWIEITDINFFPTVRENVYLFKIFFITFKPGKQMLPSLNLGALLLEGIEVDTQSILEVHDVKKIRPYRSQIEIPGTTFLIGISIFIIIAFPIIAIILFHYLKKTLKHLSKARQKDLPRNRMKRALRRLKKIMSGLDDKAFYIRLAEIIKEYLSDRLSIPAKTSTTRELIKIFEIGIQDLSLREKVRPFSEILSFSDCIKFRGIHSSSDEKLEKILEVLSIVEMLEEENKNVES